MSDKTGWKGRAGLELGQTNPTEYFKAQTKSRVEKGMDAHLVVLDGDPAADVKSLARVAYTVRSGKVIYSHY